MARLLWPHMAQQGVVMYVSMSFFSFYALYKCEDLAISALSESLYGLLCISICFFFSCAPRLCVITNCTLTEPVEAVGGPFFEGCGDWTVRRNRQNSPVSLCESVCHKDLLPTAGMTVLFRRRHPPAVQRTDKGSNRSIQYHKVEPGTPKKNVNVSLRKLTSLQTFSAVTRGI